MQNIRTITSSTPLYQDPLSHKTSEQNKEEENLIQEIRESNVGKRPKKIPGHMPQSNWFRLEQEDPESRKEVFKEKKSEGRV